jgi:hypothetical protein
MGIHSSALQHEQHLIAAYTATRPMASMYANWHTQQARPMGCCVCQLAYTIANWQLGKPMDGMLCMPIGIHNMPMGYCVCQ